MSPDISRSFAVTNFTVNTEDCQNSNASNLGQSDSYNILVHEVVTHRPCVKGVTNASTTYRDYYCRRKCLPKKQKICLPYPAIRFSEEKMSTVSTYKEHFPPFSTKDQQDSRGKIIPQRHNISCEKKCFEGKSETVAAFKRLDVRSKPLKTSRMASSIKLANKFSEKQPFTTSTTYSSEFKKPVKYKKTVSYIPNPNIRVSKEPFRHISQYKSEFQYPKVKKDISECRRRRPVSYKPITVPMDNKTTYNESYTIKIPISKPLARRYPDYGCKECKIYANKLRGNQQSIQTSESSQSDGNKINKADLEIRNPLAGDGDKSTKQAKNSCPAINYHQEIGDCNNRCLLSDKIDSDKLASDGDERKGSEK